MFSWALETRLRQAACWVVLLLIFAPPASGQGFQYLYRNYSEQDGLINNAVNGMTQGHDGRLWFATRGGITSYDGQEWVSHELAEGVFEKEFSQIKLAPGGRIWAVSRRVPFRVQYTDGHTWEQLPVPPLPYLNTQANLLAVAELPDGAPVVVVGLQSGHFATWHHGQWQMPEGEWPLIPAQAYTWYESRLLISSRGKLLFLDPGNLQQEEVAWPDLPLGPILALTTDPATGNLYLVGDSWIAVREDEQVRVVARNLDIVADQTLDRTDALVDRAGGLYFGGLSRAYYWNPQLGLETLDRNSGRQTSGATGFFMDAEGSLWIPSLRGVDKLTTRRFANLDRNQGLLQDEVTAVMQDSRGRMVLGHEGGLTFLEPEPRVLTFDLEPGDLCRVMDLAEDRRGNLWVATDGQGLARIDPLNRIRWFRETEGLHIRVFCLNIDDEGVLWVGTVVGLHRSRGSSFERVDLPEDGHNHPPFVRRIFQASDGSLYLATGRNGVFRVRGQERQQWQGDDLTTGNSTFAVYETPNHDFWIGTGVGLYILDQETLVPTSYPRPVIDRPIYCIEQDPQGRVWFGTDAGVYIWDGARLEHYSVESGLAGPEINRDGFTSDSRGRFWVATDSGVSLYQVRFDLPPLTAPRLEILEFEVDGERHPATRPLVLRHPPRALYVRFRGVSFLEENSLGMRTWLEHYEPRWSDYSTRPLDQVRYTNLPAGTYNFHVQARNSVGVESEVVVAPAITVNPALKDRWWISGLGLVLVTILGYFLISYWEGRRYARRLEKEVANRTQALETSEQAVRSESQRLAATLNSILDGVLALDGEDRVLLCNPAAEKILDRPADELVGRTLAEVLPLETGPHLDPTDDSHEWNCQGRLECPRRGTVCLEISSSPLTNPEGQRTGSVVAFSDITDRLRMERELIRSQKLESLGLLAGGIAHDFNNLLTIMLGNIDLVEGAEALGDLDRESLSLARQASLRARTLTEQLLTFARGGAPRRQTTALDEIIHQSVALSFSGLNVSCSLDLAEDLWLVYIDTGQIHQVLNNLLINAAQAMPDGGKVRLVARNLHRTPDFLEPGQWVRIDVIDQGAGIPEAHLTRIFDPYFTTKSQGTGLGLATSFSIVSRHGGKITVDSRPGRGTTFSVFLPRSQGQQEQTETANTYEVPAGRRVLVLEDEEGIHRILNRYLEKLQLTAVFTRVGEETVAEYRRGQETGQPYAVVITDLTIPEGMGGRETLDHLLAIDPHVRAVVISGYSQEDVMAHYQQYGFKAALGKPFGFEELSRVLAEVLEQDEPDTE